MAGKRAVALEQHFGQERDLLPLHIRKLAQEPAPEDAVALADELQWILNRLVPLQRRMVELRLQGNSLDEIAAATGRNAAHGASRTEKVRRALKSAALSLQIERPLDGKR